MFESINPATGEHVASYPPMTWEEIESLVTEAEQGLAGWRELPVPDRAARFRTVAEGLRERKERLACLMAEEMGKPLGEGRAEIDKCAWLCEHFADCAADLLRPEQIESDANKSYVSYEPLGVLLAIMPWNFPFWQVFRCAVPAMLAGNVVLVKHAPNVTGCALAIEELVRDAHLPKGTFGIALANLDDTGKLIEHPAVRAITLTGSTRAGRDVARRAGGALKKTVLELGGSDPYLVLDDADLVEAAAASVTARLINCGQSCIAAKRLIVTASVASEFESRVVDGMRAARVGDPLDPATQLGPLAREDLRETLHRQVTESIRAGARCLLGGSVPAGPGFFYPPTVLSDVGPEMPVYEEEVFGPVAVIVAASDEAEAVRIANDTSYGLGAAVFTADPARGEKILRTRVAAGSCFVNAFVRSDPRLPFGGVKNSGYGRELGPQGLREFVNVKTVYVA